MINFAFLFSKKFLKSQNPDVLFQVHRGFSFVDIAIHYVPAILPHLTADSQPFYSKSGKAATPALAGYSYLPHGYIAVPDLAIRYNYVHIPFIIQKCVNHGHFRLFVSVH